MPENTIKHEKITKPFQLLAAWLTGLIATNSSFLLAAANIESPDWVPGLLVIAAVINVPIFLVALFLLQTKFRPQMQDDKYFSKYLENEAYRDQYSSLSIKVEGQGIENIRKAALSARSAVDK